MSVKRLMGVRPGLQANGRIDSVEVSLSTASSHTSSYQTISWDTIEHDTGGIFDTTNHSWTPNVSGFYLHNINIRFSAAEVWYLTFRDVTGSADLLNKQRYNTLIASYGAYWAWSWWLEAGNEYDIRCYTTTLSSIQAISDSRMWITGPLVTT